MLLRRSKKKKKRALKFFFCAFVERSYYLGQVITWPRTFTVKGKKIHLRRKVSVDNRIGETVYLGIKYKTH